MSQRGFKIHYKTFCFTKNKKCLINTEKIGTHLILMSEIIVTDLVLMISWF